jgi:uncharacterized membrane protein
MFEIAGGIILAVVVLVVLLSIVTLWAEWGPLPQSVRNFLILMACVLGYLIWNWSTIMHKP